jgi:tetratricopeptide (TPR) repeat protein
VADRSAAHEALLALEPVYAMRGPIARYLALLERASRDAAAPGGGGAELLVAEARALSLAGSAAGAEASLARALDLARTTGARAAEAAARATLGLIELRRGRTDVAEVEYALARELTDPADDLAVGDILLKVGNLELARGAHGKAKEAYVAAITRLTDAGDLRRTGWALGNLAIVTFYTGGDPSTLYLRAIEIAQELGDHRAEGYSRGNLAQLYQDRGDWPAAEVCYREGSDLLRAVGDRRGYARLLMEFGTLFHERGELSAARARYVEALDVIRAIGDRGTQGFCLACVTTADVGLGRCARARDDFDQAERLLLEAREPNGALVVDLHRGLLHLAEGRRAIAEATLARAAGVPDKPSDLRFAVRALEAALVASARAGLHLGPSGRWFEAPGVSRVDLAHREALRLILVRLAEAHAARPGEPIASADLLAAGWPGERVLPSAGANRVRVALSTLRKLGLRAALVARREGWLLDAGVRVTRDAG